jgi:hypothetical protein
MRIWKKAKKKKVNVTFAGLGWVMDFVPALEFHERFVLSRPVTERLEMMRWLGRQNPR